MYNRPHMSKQTKAPLAVAEPYETIVVKDIPRIIYLPKSKILEGFGMLGGLPFFVRGILRVLGASRDDIQVIVGALQHAATTKEPISMTIRVGKEAWTMVLS